MINYVLVVYGLAVSLLGIGQPEVRLVRDDKQLKYAINFRRHVKNSFPSSAYFFLIVSSEIPV